MALAVPRQVGLPGLVLDVVAQVHDEVGVHFVVHLPRTAKSRVRSPARCVSLRSLPCQRASGPKCRSVTIPSVTSSSIRRIVHYGRRA